jgi:hypothetical protein
VLRHLVTCCNTYIDEGRKGRIQQDFGSGKGLRGMSFGAFDGED